MCMPAGDRLTFATLWEDPLIRMVMASDGISERETRTLMTHIREVVTKRSGLQPAGRSVCALLEPSDQAKAPTFKPVAWVG